MTTQRWTDEMLDNLVVSIQSLRDTVASHDRQNEEREQRTIDLEEQMQILAVSMNRLAESSLEYSLWKVENDLRFNILLEEIRSVTRRVEVLENQ
jgi:hypothetical protein